MALTIPTPLNETFKILKIHNKDWMIDFGIKDWNHSFSEFNNRDHLINEFYPFEVL